jgi:hypothetical protein
LNAERAIVDSNNTFPVDSMAHHAFRRPAADHASGAPVICEPIQEPGNFDAGPRCNLFSHSSLSSAA